MAIRSESPPTEHHIEPTKLQDNILGLLEDAGIDTNTNDQIMKLIEEAELTLAEKAWDRHQEKLMEDGPGPSLLDRQREAMKFK